MDYLPNEVLLSIFGYLNYTRDVINCAKVCRRWNGLLSGEESLLSGKVCVLRCTSKLPKAKHLWRMIKTRKPFSVRLNNADAVCVQLLLKHHPSVSSLAVSCTTKNLTKVMRSLCLYRDLTQLKLHVRGGSLMQEYSLQWVNHFRSLRKLTVKEIGCIVDDRLPSSVSHLTIKHPARLPSDMRKIFTYITCLKVSSVSNDMFSVLSGHLHNLKTCVLLHCNLSGVMEFPTSLITELKMQGQVAGYLKLDKILDLHTVCLNLKGSLPECVLPSSVRELSLRGTSVPDPHWFLGLSVACTSISKLDLKGLPVKSNIAASLGTRFPQLTHLNIIGCLYSRGVDHMYLLALLQEAAHLRSLSCDPPPTCSLADLRGLFPGRWISSVDYCYVGVSTDLPPVQNSSTVIDMGEMI